jgi:hypothetical protein
MRTQLTIAEKEKNNLCNIAEEESFHIKMQRSQPKIHKKSMGNLITENQNKQSSIFYSSVQK